MELRDVAERGKAPRGSIYHHFPGGKAQLAREAAELEGETIRATIERSLQERGLKATLAMFGEVFRRRVAAFRSWEGPIAAALIDAGVGRRDAEDFAGLVVSTVEGALIRARAAGSAEPLDSAIAGLERALDALLGRAR
jgi:AcrR family transcriptional regulator